MKILYNLLIILIIAITMTEHAHTMIVGHRGCRGLRPENTMAAFRHALDMGVDGIELDVHLTKDGKLVVHHDYDLSPDLTRDKNGHWLTNPVGPIRNMTLAELQVYSLGKINPGTQYLNHHPDLINTDDETLPQLKDVLKLAEAYPNAQVLIEIKTSQLYPFASSEPEALTRAVIKEINNSGIKDRCAILAFDTRVLKFAKKDDPEITLYLNYMKNTLDNSPWYNVVGYFMLNLFNQDLRKPGPQQAHDIGATYWSSTHDQITSESVKQAHDLGLKVMAWTVNSPTEAKRLIDMGVDTIATDRPDIMLQALK